MLACHPYDVRNPIRNKLVRPLQAEVQERKLWACHLGPELGGQGYGQVKLGLMNEILGGVALRADRVRLPGARFRQCRNPRPLRHARAEEALSAAAARQRNRLGFSMTEPQGGADPKVFKTKAELKGDNWVINGQKWFSSNAHLASFLIVMAVTDPDAADHTSACRCSSCRPRRRA